MKRGAGLPATNASAAISPRRSLSSATSWLSFVTVTAILSESNSRLAMLDLERGRAAFEKGQIGVGMLWIVESLRMAAEAGDEAGRHVALANLSAWRRHQVELKAVFTHGNAVDVVAGDRKFLLHEKLHGMGR